MTALSYTRPWRLKPDRWAPRSFLITWAVVSVVTSLVSSLPLSLCRQWASIRPAAFVLLQRRLGWMRWGTRWPGHTGTWRSSTWSDRRKFSSFSLCLISTRSVWIVETLLKVYSSEEKCFPSQSFSGPKCQLLNEYSWSPEDYDLLISAPVLFSRAEITICAKTKQEKHHNLWWHIVNNSFMLL